MSKRSESILRMLVLLAMMLIWQPGMQAAQAQTIEVCAQCHPTATVAAFHHTAGNVPGFPFLVCSACHGTPFVFKADCFQCHAFAGPGAPDHDEHTGFIPGQIASCEACHTDGVPGGPLREPFGECGECHSGFQGGQSSPLHQAHINNFGAGDCTICHGPSAPACNQCHMVDRHDYRNGPGAQGHDFHTNFIANCERCHVSGIAGGPLREPFGECAVCHSGFQNGLSGPLHKEHTTSFGAADCAICHGDDAPACNQCHQVDRHDFRNGVGAPGHDFHTLLITDCQRCHVSGVEGGPLREPFGKCASCHSGFQGGLNGPMHQQHTTAFGAGDCTICHGPEAPACNQCHQVDRHDFRNGIGAQGHDFHTGIIPDCQLCHVSGVPGGPLREPFTECAACHSGFGGPGQPLHDRHTNRFGASDCTICHGASAPACTSCHRVNNHDFRAGGGDGHSKHSRVSCSRCHPSGVPGGPIKGPFGECSSCHRDFSRPGQSLHDRHTSRYGASDCNLCHADNAPVCNACHRVKSHDFRSRGSSGHSKHSRFSCGACHGSGGSWGGGWGDSGRSYGGSSGGSYGGSSGGSYSGGR